MLSTTASELLDILPEDGSPLSQQAIRFELEIGAESYRQAKSELKEAGLVTLGRGRGGTVSRVSGEDLPKVIPATRPVPREESIKFAQEANKVKTSAQKETDELRARITALVTAELGIEADRVTVTFYGSDQKPIIEVRNDDDKGSSMYTLKEAIL